MKHNFSKWVNLSKNSINSVAVFNTSSVHNSLYHWDKMLPKIQPFYAIKSFSHRFMLDSVNSCKINTGFDVASSTEVKQVLNYKKPVIFSHPVKTTSEILFAKSKRIEFLVVDSMEEVEKIYKYYPSAKVIIRVKSSEKYSTIKFNCKFGADFNQVVDILSRRKLLDIVGFSFHVGSKCGDMKAYTETLDEIINNYLPLAEFYRHKIQLVDIGGGFENFSDIEYLSKISNKQINFLTEEKNIKCIAEPGRYLSKRSITLFTKITGVKFVNDTFHIYLNDSIYNSFSGKSFDHQKFKPIPCYKRGELVKCTIWGNTCDGEDKIIQDCFIPKPRVNDVIMWENMGSYSLSSSVNGFNGFEMADVYLS